LQTDPYEMTNLYEEESYREIREELHKRLEELRNNVGDNSMEIPMDPSTPGTGSPKRGKYHVEKRIKSTPVSGSNHGLDSGCGHRSAKRAGRFRLCCTQRPDQYRLYRVRYTGDPPTFSRPEKRRCRHTGRCRSESAECRLYSLVQGFATRCGRRLVIPGGMKV